ncbi:hypothetical protein ABK040_006053 [Willaertia magna]
MSQTNQQEELFASFPFTSNPTTNEESGIVGQQNYFIYETNNQIPSSPTSFTWNTYEGLPTTIPFCVNNNENNNTCTSPSEFISSSPPTTVEIQQNNNLDTIPSYFIPILQEDLKSEINSQYNTDSGSSEINSEETISENINNNTINVNKNLENNKEPFKVNLKLFLKDFEENDIFKEIEERIEKKCVEGNNEIICSVFRNISINNKDFMEEKERNDKFNETIEIYINLEEQNISNTKLKKNERIIPLFRKKGSITKNHYKLLSHQYDIGKFIPANSNPRYKRRMKITK